MGVVAAPEAAYQWFWIRWSIAALLVGGGVLVLAARLWLVNPLIRSNHESAGRVIRAIHEMRHEVKN